MLNSAILAYWSVLFAKSVAGAAIALSLTPPENVSQPVLESFVSFSIEFSSFPDFAGKCKGKMISFDVKTKKAWIRVVNRDMNGHLL